MPRIGEELGTMLNMKHRKWGLVAQGLCHDGAGYKYARLLDQMFRGTGLGPIKNKAPPHPPSPYPGLRSSMIRWSKRYPRIHGVKIPFMDCTIPAQEIHRASVTVVDPNPTPIDDLFGDGDPCLHESPSSPGSFSVSPLLEDNEVVPVVFAEEPTYEKFDKLLSNLPRDARFQLHRTGQFEKVSEIFDNLKFFSPTRFPPYLSPTPIAVTHLLTSR